MEFDREKQMVELSRSRLLWLRKNKMGVQQEVFAQAANVEASTYTRWELGATSRIPRASWEAMARLGNVSPAWLQGFDMPMTELFSNTVPLVDLSTQEEIGKILVDPALGASLALRLDDTMDRSYPAGTIAFVRSGDPNQGQLVAARVQAGVVVRWWKRYNKIIVLQSDSFANPKIGDELISPTTRHFELIGIVCRVQTDL
jgi:hypothetical protein